MRNVTLYEDRRRGREGFLLTSKPPGAHKPVPAVVGITVAEIEKLREEREAVVDRLFQERGALVRERDEAREALDVALMGVGEPRLEEQLAEAQAKAARYRDGLEKVREAAQEDKWWWVYEDIATEALNG